MPPLASVTIPVIWRAPLSSDRPSNKGKTPIRRTYAPRTYGDEPLPTRLSGQAPRNAQIVGRVIENGVRYQLKIGEVEINDVGVDEILDYVSALDLEQYEHQQFVEEREVLRVVDAEQQTLKTEKLERAKERAKRKGVVLFEDADSADGQSDEVEQVYGKHGRARPTYKHLFKKVHERKRRKRDPETGELVPLSDEAQDPEVSEEPPEPRAPSEGGGPSTNLEELPKRRRRKRNKITGELLPLSPVAQQPTVMEIEEKKRQRRRRHPQTGELMPIGWHYDPANEGHTYNKRRDGRSTPSFRKLSISQEHEAKRQRLDTASSVSRSPSPIPTKAEIAAQLSQSSQRTPKQALHSAQKPVILELLSSDDEVSAAQPSKRISTSLKPQPTATGSAAFGTKREIGSSVSSSSTEPSSNLEARTSILRPSAKKASELSSSAARSEKARSQRTHVVQTSITNPSAARASSTDPLAQPSENDAQSESELDEGEWFIEAILSHHMSDPTTHPLELGKKAIMLYQVKWEGYDRPTWEPIDSFGDRNLVHEYRRRVGLKSEPSEEAHPTAKGVTKLTTSSTGQSVRPTTSADSAHIGTAQEDEDEDNDDIEDDEFEVESIVAHHISDPKSHPAGLGNKPVMLYHVKWKGWPDLTWEPARSFGTSKMLRLYQVRKGLIPETIDADGDQSMIKVV